MALDRTKLDAAVQQARTALQTLTAALDAAGAADSVAQVADPAPVPAPAPAPAPVTPSTVALTLTPGDGVIDIAWTLTKGTDGGDGVILSRNGTDTTGGGPWTEPNVVGTSGSKRFDKLANGTAYTITAQPTKAGTAVGTPASKTATPVAPAAPAPTPAPTPAPSSSNPRLAALKMPARGWFSGAAGNDVDNLNPAFGTYRGDPVDMMSNWLDPVDGGGWGWGVLGGNDGPVAGFRGLLDLAIGGPSGANWASWANGAVDAKFRDAMTRLRANRTIGGVVYPTILRPGHELNGNWYGWSVPAGGEAAFVAACRRLKGILAQVYPEALMAVCFNGDTVTGVDVAKCFAADVFDLIGVDQYNMYPFIGRRADGSYQDWDSAIGALKSDGKTPRGIEAWRKFAEARGVPLYLPEYANRGYGDQANNYGDDPYWINKFIPWVKAHAGRGAGQVLGECWFNMWPEYALTGSEARQPNVKAAYAALFPVA